jgi:ubiquinone/menaquinone biosynthesis C-methylase UbiE
VRLNIGSGVHPAPDWINFDAYREHGEVQVQGSALALPFADGSAERVYLGHTLEHLSYDYDAISALKEARRVLNYRGTLGVVGPAMDYALEQGEPQHIIDAIEAHLVDGRPEGKPGWGHLWTATSENTLALVRKVFPHSLEVKVSSMTRSTGWPNTVVSTWQVAIIASKS